MILQNARVIDPSQNLDAEKDILIEDGKIKAIDKPGSFATSAYANTLKKDFKGKVITPGLIDVHVHLREPGQIEKETIETGARAAVVGGFTSVACMANTSPVNDSAMVTQFILQKAREANLARVFPIGAVTQGLKGERLAEIGLMIEAGACAISDDGMPVMNSLLMRKAMEYAATFNVALISHAEDLNLTLSPSGKTGMNEGAMSALLGIHGNPKASEEIMVAREIALARLTGARIHIAHLSTKEGLDHVRRAKEAGLKVTAEVTPHHLLLNDSQIHSYCSHHKMAPPLRAEQDQMALLAALNEGLIDMIASDHAPHGCVDKDAEFELAANGILGLQTTLPLMLGLVAEKKLNLNRMIDSLTQQPAKLLGQNNIGTLKVGSKADLTVMDLNAVWELTDSMIVSKSVNTPFINKKYKGRAECTIVGGQIKYELGQKS
jgi:dihydroorotase